MRAEAMLASSVAQLGQARAMHRQAEISHAYATVRAPYPGVITQRHVSRGVYVDPGDPVVTLVNDEDLEIEADVPFERIRALEPGTVVRVGLNGVADRNAVVRAVVPNENPLTRTRIVRFTPDFTGPALSLAVTVSVKVPSERLDPVRSTDQLPPLAVTVVVNTVALLELVNVTATELLASAVPAKTRVASFVI